MTTTTALSRPSTTASLQLTALVCIAAILAPAHADPSGTSKPAPTDVSRNLLLDASPADELSVASNPWGSVIPSTGDGDGDALNSVAPQGNEMSVLAGVELERTDRRFRSRVVDWAMDRSVAAGLATDFLLHGMDRGVHLRLSGSEYVVRWETRF